MNFICDQLNMVISEAQIPIPSNFQEVSDIDLIMPSNESRIVIDKLAKGVAKFGSNVEKEVRNRILGKRIHNSDLHRLLVEQEPGLRKYFCWRVFSY